MVQCGAVADWWYSWPMASTLTSLCLGQRWTFWTYVVTINLFSLYLMNFMLHTMLDATGVVLRVHTSMKCDVLFSQGRVHTIVRWGGHFSYMSKKCFLHSLQQCKNYKNRSRFSKVMINNVLPVFLWFTVYLATKYMVNKYYSWWFSEGLARTSGPFATSFSRSFDNGLVYARHHSSAVQLCELFWQTT